MKKFLIFLIFFLNFQFVSAQVNTISLKQEIDSFKTEVVPVLEKLGFKGNGKMYFKFNKETYFSVLILENKILFSKKNFKKNGIYKQVYLFMDKNKIFVRIRERLEFEQEEYNSNITEVSSKKFLKILIDYMYKIIRESI